MRDPRSRLVRDAFPQKLEGASALQRRLSARVLETPLRRRPQRVAGVDVSYDTARGTLHAAAVLMDSASRQVLRIGRFSGPVAMPYVPGFLSFREGPAVLEALADLGEKPDLLLCDGQGRAHPRRFGLACHLGLALDMPSIGVAKSRLCGEARTPGARRGATTRLVDRGELIGRVVRTRDGVRPLVVSVGHRIDLASARSLVLAWAFRVRLPEPTHRADREVAAMRREAQARARSGVRDA